MDSTRSNQIISCKCAYATRVVYIMCVYRSFSDNGSVAEGCQRHALVSAWTYIHRTTAKSLFMSVSVVCLHIATSELPFESCRVPYARLDSALMWGSNLEQGPVGVLSVAVVPPLTVLYYYRLAASICYVSSLHNGNAISYHQSASCRRYIPIIWIRVDAISAAFSFPHSLR
jgi:hypothetical protein